MESIDINRLRKLLLSWSDDPDGPLEDFCRVWQKPRAMLDGDLQKYINEAKGTSGIFGGHHVSWPQVRVLIEAFRTRQYNTTIRFLLTNFSGEVFPVRLPGHGTKCIICEKDIMYWKEWSETVKACPGLGEFENRNFLAYGTKTSKVCICLNCLVQLRAANELLNKLDPEILNYKKCTPGSLKP